MRGNTPGMATPTAQAPTKENKRLRARYGPWAVVTGASEGIGRECAVCLAEAGVHLVLVARREDVLQEFARDLAHLGVEVRVVAADLGTANGVDAVVARSEDLEVGLLVAAAGFGTSGPFVEADLAQELGMIDLNCRAVASLSHHFGGRFVARQRGGLVLLSSLVAFQGVPRIANYAATKAWVQSFAEGLRLELAPHGVDVLASAPGPTQSGFARRADMKIGASAPTAELVARETLSALGRQATVRPGWLSKVLEGSLSLLPRFGRVRMLGMVMRGMTGG